ncbi:uncharacterized protein CEXT_581461 [Caerostris extrusa]|uniref:Uncharacterized protein n=1 Tax=Caerostris extrusa TaxID=172846 RepID=A0AAV4NWL3_CAEEX|nr:uncharacterized protein CEXT_581461 [Caerostris extrusa]
MNLLVASAFVLLHVTVTLSQRYAERNPLPVDTLPFDDNYYDEDYTEGYDFYEDKDIYRWNVDEFPHPQDTFRFCNRMKPSYVCDPDQVLKKEDADKLDTFILQLYKDTPCICNDCRNETGGIIIGIALLKHMFQPYNKSQLEHRVTNSGEIMEIKCLFQLSTIFTYIMFYIAVVLT